MRQRLLAKAANLRASASTPTSPREGSKFVSALDDSKIAELSRRRPRRNSLFEWGKSSFRSEIIGVDQRLKALQEYVKKKEKRPHYSQIHGGKIEVMTADDDQINQLVFEGLLSPLGYVVTPAMDGDEALKLVRSREYLPDVVLLDVQMPGKTGYEVCADLRKEFPDGLPIIMISANTDEASILQGLQVGANDYIKKPFSRAELIARVETQIRLRDGWMAEVEAVRSNDLLGQALPEHVTEQLHEGEKAAAEAHECITFLFSEIVGFKNLALEVRSTELFEMLNRMYTVFDTLADKHGVYRVDTFGDVYMLAAGHEDKSKEDHCVRMLAMAKDMLKATKVLQSQDCPNIQIRIGMHSGPALSGVIGVKCPKYTFIGDTVNTANLMESYGFPMCIHVSNDAKNLLSEKEEWIGIENRTIEGECGTYIAKVGEWESASASQQIEVCPNLVKRRNTRASSHSIHTQTEYYNEEDYHSNPPQVEISQHSPRTPNLPPASQIAHRDSIYALRNLKSTLVEGCALHLNSVTELLSELSDAIAKCTVESIEREQGWGRAELRAHQARADARMISIQLDEMALDLQALNEASELYLLQEAGLRSDLTRTKADLALRETCARSLASEIQTLRAASTERLRTQEANDVVDRTLRESIALDAVRLRDELALLSRQNEDLKTQLRLTQRPIFQRDGSSTFETPPTKCSERVTLDNLAKQADTWIRIEGGKVPEILSFLGLEHYATVLEREEIQTVSALAQLSDEQLETVGVRSRGARLVLMEVARGLRAVAGRVHDGCRRRADTDPSGRRSMQAR